MRIVQLIYASTRSADCTQTDLMNILRSSRKNNELNDITGILVCDNQYFLQLIEGGVEQINKLFLRITKDERHGDVIILSYEEVEARNYSNWKMGYVDIMDKKKDILFKYSSGKDFSPYSLSASGAKQLLADLALIHEAALGNTP